MRYYVITTNDRVYHRTRRIGLEDYRVGRAQNPGMMSSCEVSIDVPSWVPAAIAFGISVAVAIAVIIAYILREMERYRTFYGREDKLSSKEQPAEIKKKEEMDAYVLGRCSEEVLVIKSPPQNSPGAQGTARSGVKVMLRKKRVIMRTPIKPPATSIPASLEVASPNVINFTVVYDKTGRAFELIDVLNKEPVVQGTRTKRADALLQQIKDRLEAAGSKPKSTVKKTQMSGEPEYKVKMPKSINL
ncbi:hypothetical protein OSTOST_03160 [Ostertagia ostertagi]